jgi:hypothetical protein
MTRKVQKLPREKSVDVTHLQELHEKLLREEKRNVEEIVAVEKLIVESSEDLEPVNPETEQSRLPIAS